MRKTLSLLVRHEINNKPFVKLIILIMKKLLLFVLVFGFVYTTSAQKIYKRVSNKLPNTETLMEAPSNAGSDIGKVDRHELKTTLDGRDVSLLPIGNSGNSYGIYGNPRTYVWADPWVNSVVFTHRMLGGTEVEGNSRIAYDVSTDGGETWTNNVQAYTPTGPDPGTGYPENAGRYPQGLIINNSDNTDPANAHYAYLICTLDNTNNGGTWGGFAYGSNVLTEVDPPNPSQNNDLTSGTVYRLIPDAFHTTPQGVVWYADGSQPYDGAAYNYDGTYIVGKGMIGEESGELEITEDYPSILAAGDGINDTKIAFGDDGMTGYLLIMSDAASDPPPYTGYHPVIVKTTDGGETWNDPIQVQFGGVDGIESIKNYWSDSAILTCDAYQDGFVRDEVWYNMGYHVDLVVDENNNPYITGLITIGADGGWYPYTGKMATWNLYSEDGGVTWNADPLYDNIWQEGAIGDIFEYNRPYASRSVDGHYLFFSWLDSESDQAEQNDRPNIYVIGYDVEDHTYSEVNNVTAFTLAWNAAFFGSQSYYVLGGGEPTDDMYTFEIPFVYESFTVPGDDTQQCDFWYVKGFTLQMPVGTPELQADEVNFKVDQNFPNPAVANTQILVTSETHLPIELTVCNLLGQEVYTDRVETNAKVHRFDVNVSGFAPGIYTYTVAIGDKNITKKMLVK